MFSDNENVVVVTEPRNCEYILKTNFKNYIKGHRFNEKLGDVLGDGIFNADGHKWKLQRKTASHMFSTRALRENMAPVISRHVKHLVAVLDSASTIGETVDMQELFLQLTLNSIGEIAFGCDLSNPKMAWAGGGFGHAFDRTQKYTAARYINPIWRLCRKFNILDERKLRTAITDLDDCVADVIVNRKKLAETDGLDGCTDLLSRFMQMSDVNGVPFNDKYLRDVITNYMIAGRDTTANALTWGVYELAKHPDAQAKLLKEILEALGTDRPPTYHTVDSMAFAQAVVMETLRLHPSVPRDPKLCLADDLLPDGTFIPAGTTVVYAPWCQGRMESEWGKDCEKYIPERFIGRNPEDKPSPFKFNAFQAGPRTCLGMNMAYLEAKLTLVSLVQNFQFDLVQTTEPSIQFTVTLPMADGLRVRVCRRQAES
ncbi:hypothetical protein SARC_12678 [Sphaeroforma arctica JP610]|uniref:Cytochrome P450 n=1 Tax=Sphaeroforma arctica JP610 TaxID=667725 RepID=A0A0L0FDE3_9EUKA|nr:hypothetical protein SARC_12678 [Sphaeroforma arctica JP610]KNC74782.1 hypothetical protein SARC_12678 [Sphaeroforma arctica JP610]|eukprot:XP_014148684.1 hypothetical protein SARC_12678 [Sphaeroforma arctica JP610]